MIDRGYGRLVARLEKSGIAVASLQPRSVAEMYAYWEKLGMLTGKTDQARRMTQRFSAAVEAFRRLTEDVSPQKAGLFRGHPQPDEDLCPRGRGPFCA